MVLDLEAIISRVLPLFRSVSMTSVAGVPLPLVFVGKLAPLFCELAMYLKIDLFRKHLATERAIIPVSARLAGSLFLRNNGSEEGLGLRTKQLKKTDKYERLLHQSSRHTLKKVPAVRNGDTIVSSEDSSKELIKTTPQINCSTWATSHRIHFRCVRYRSANTSATCVRLYSVCRQDRCRM